MELSDNDSGNNLIVKAIHQNKLYTDDTRRFPVTSRAGNQYVMIEYHSSNFILAQHFATRKDEHRIEAYNAIMIMMRLKATGLAMVNKRKVEYQLVPPYMHRRNAAERAIRTFMS